MVIGLPLQDYVTALPPGYWVARAIYVPGESRWYQTRVGTLHDRQGFLGDLSDVDKKGLARWINKKGLNLLRKRLYLEGVGTRDTRLVAISDPPFYLYADPRGSCGYLYLAAWKEGTCRSDEKSNKPPTSLPSV